MTAVLYRSASGAPLLRIGARAAFFIRKPIGDVVAGLRRVFDAWLDAVPEEGKRWCLVGTNAEEEKPFTKATQKRCLSELEKAVKRDGGYFYVVGPEDPVGDYRCEIDLNDGVDGAATTCHLVQLDFPIESGSGANADQLIETVVGWARLLPFDSGYLSPALLFPNNMDLEDAPKTITSLAFRHPGYDVSDNGATALKIGGLSRGARWVTFLGPTQVAALGGVDALRRNLHAPLTVDAVGDGVMIRAGAQAEIGDVNRGDDLPLLRAVAKAIEPVTYFRDPFSVLGARTEEWERRFLK